MLYFWSKKLRFSQNVTYTNYRVGSKAAPSENSKSAKKGLDSTGSGFATLLGIIKKCVSKNHFLGEEGGGREGEGREEGGGRYGRGLEHFSS